jgi:hypothetical protein
VQTRTHKHLFPITSRPTCLPLPYPSKTTRCKYTATQLRKHVAYQDVQLDHIQPICTSQEAGHLSRPPSRPPHLGRNPRNLACRPNILERSQGSPGQAPVQLDHPSRTSQAQRLEVGWGRTRSRGPGCRERDRETGRGESKAVHVDAFLRNMLNLYIRRFTA